MATFTFFQDFKEQMAKGVHDFDNHTFKIRLTNTAPNVATHTAAADFTAITGGSYADATTTITVSETGGTATIGDTNSDVSWTASGTDFTAFAYAVLYNDTPTTPIADPVIGYIATGSQTITAGNTFALSVGAGGFFTLA